MASLATYKLQAKRSPGKQIKWRDKGWSFILELDPFIGWHFSAMLWPAGRSSAEEDWKHLGYVMSGLVDYHDPIELAILPFDEAHPNDVQHFAWTEKDGKAEKLAPDVTDTMVKGLRAIRSIRADSPGFAGPSKG